MAKRATLPSANDTLIGRKVEKEKVKTPKVEKSKKSIGLKPKSTIDKKIKTTKDKETETPKVPRTQTSIHLTDETLKRLEEVKYRLFADHNLKAKKSAIVELALKEGLSNLEQLAQALQGS